MTSILITYKGEPVGVAESPDDAREVIRYEHDLNNPHLFTLASGRCPCLLDEAALDAIDDGSVWEGGRASRAGWFYWRTEPLTPR
ncbi:hypothetical protein [Streptomyces albus]|uniref:hypothetical protein n=1 Tax=Streptomyces sp. NRRL F-5917 TaxID=1463873 RepID=UPI0004BF8EB1|nr:hypothetical protein [Streptomyces sp. NRRL F-5917]